MLYLLHGSDDVSRCWLDRTDLLELSASTDAIVVLPEGGVVGYYTDWAHPAKDGIRPEWERFHLEEIRQHVLAGFRTTPRAVIGGLSMGGYGALAYAAKHPARFSAVASLSGLPHTTLRGVPAFLAFVLRRQHEPMHGPWGSPRGDRSRWLDNDVHHLADRLDGLAVYLAAGDGKPADGDTTYPFAGAVERLCARSTWSFAARLDELGIPYTASRYAGTHDWPYWRREFRRVWPFLAAQLERLRVA